MPIREFGLLLLVDVSTTTSSYCLEAKVVLRELLQSFHYRTRASRFSAYSQYTPTGMLLLVGLQNQGSSLLVPRLDIAFETFWMTA